MDLLFNTILPYVQEELGSEIDVAALQAIAALQHKCLPGTHLPLESLENWVCDVTWAVRYATACYGAAGETYLTLADPSRSFERVAGALGNLVTSPLASEAEEAAFSRLAGIPRSAVLLKGGGDVGLPKYFLVEDLRASTLVLVIRGTLTLADAMTDAIARPVPFCGGWAHAGISHSAAAIWAACGERTLAELAARPGWKLTVTGHSLGGATAVLLCVLLHTTGEAAPACVSFAGPPAFTPVAALSPAIHAAITSVVHRHDLVPRISVQSLRELGRVGANLRAANRSLAGAPAQLDLSFVRAHEPQWAAAWLDGVPVAHAARGERGGEGAGGEGPLGRLDTPGLIFAFSSPEEALDAGAGAAGEARPPREGRGAGQTLGAAPASQPLRALPPAVASAPAPSAPAPAPAASSLLWDMLSMAQSAAGAVSGAVGDAAGTVGGPAGRQAFVTASTLAGSTVAAVGSAVVSGATSAVGDAATLVGSAVGGAVAVAGAAAAVAGGVVVSQAASSVASTASVVGGVVAGTAATVGGTAAGRRVAAAVTGTVDGTATVVGAMGSAAAGVVSGAVSLLAGGRAGGGGMGGPLAAAGVTFVSRSELWSLPIHAEAFADHLPHHYLHGLVALQRHVRRAAAAAAATP